MKNMLPAYRLFSFRYLFFILISVTLFTAGCGKKNRFSADLKGITVSPVYLHFEDDLYAIPDSLFFRQFPEIFPKYAPLFMQDSADSLITAEMLLFRTDPGFVELMEQKEKRMGNMSEEKQAIEMVLKHYRYYYPDAPDHTIFTHMPGLDMSLLQHPVSANDTLAIICTDFFLGSDFEPYQIVGIPAYKRIWMEPSQMAVELARELAFLRAGMPDKVETLLDQMVFEGKILCFLDAMMPTAPDSVKIRYTASQLTWCKENQKHVWAYLVNNKMLFSSDQNHAKLLIQDAPFTPVFTEASPGRLGHWFGWQIVRRYMEKNPTLTIVDLMEEQDAGKILNGSGYKPR